ncbi:hypothetical protein [Roseimarinus sediminis]|uniref:hypothetical protein n=1 Tax=Roseimarinus sediminis TaxID=1610899 RepID=UPI003D241CA4
MFRTEVIKTKNLRKTGFYKAFNAFSIVFLLFIILLTLNIFGEDTLIGKLDSEEYNNIVQPVVLGVALLILLTSSYMRNAAKNASRLGTLEIDQDKIVYLVQDEIQETFGLEGIERIEFEFFSTRMRGNPIGGMNYFTLFPKNGESKTYELVIANSMVKAEFGELLEKINQKVPVEVTYSYFLKKLFKDSDFKW